MYSEWVLFTVSLLTFTWNGWTMRFSEGSGCLFRTQSTVQMFTFAFPSTTHLFSEGQSSETVFQSPTFSRCGSMSLTFQRGERHKPMRFGKKF